MFVCFVENVIWLHLSGVGTILGIEACIRSACLHWKHHANQNPDACKCMDLNSKLRSVQQKHHQQGAGHWGWAWGTVKKVKIGTLSFLPVVLCFLIKALTD